jgi:hypothetical protein
LAPGSLGNGHEGTLWSNLQVAGGCANHQFWRDLPVGVSAKVGGAQTSGQVEAEDPSGSPRHPIDGFASSA